MNTPICKLVYIYRQRYLWVYFSFLFLLFQAQTLQSQSTYTFDIKRLTINEGLPSNRVYDIIEDENEIIWILTDRSIVKYDGWNFEEIYTLKNQNAQYSKIFIKQNHIYFIQFKRREYGMIIKNIDAVTIINIANKKDENLAELVGKTEFELKFIQTADFFRVFDTDGYQYKFDEKGNVNHEPLEDKIRLNNSLVYDFQNEKIIAPTIPNFSIPSNSLMEFLVYNDSLSFFLSQDLSSEKTLLRLNHNSHKLEEVNLRPGKNLRNEINSIIKCNNDIFIYSKNNTGKIGLFYNPITSYTQSSENMLDDILESYTVSKTFVKNGNLWWGTSRGIFIISKTGDKQFKKIKTDKIFSHRSFSKWSENEIIANTYAGTKLIDLKSEEIREIEGPLSKNIAVTILQLSSDKFIIGNYRKGIIYYDKKTEQSQYINTPASYRNKGNWSIILEKHEDKILFNTVYALYELNDQFECVLFEGFEKIKENIVIKMTVSDKGLFLCTNKGLWIYDESKKIFEQKFKDIIVNTIVSDKDIEGLYWISTSRGLLKWNSIGNTNQIYSTENILSSNIITSIHQDDYNNLWCPSFHGLMQIDKQNMSSYTYFKEDGLSNNEFNFHSDYVTEDGQVILGTIENSIVFHPKDFSEKNKKDSELKILKITKSTKDSKTDVTASISETGSLKIDPSITFTEFLLFDESHYHAKKKIIRYSLIPKGDTILNWRDLQKNILLIPRQAYGSYDLHIQSYNEKQNWSKNIKLNLEFEKPFYLKKTVIAFACLCLLGLFYFFYKNRTQNILRDKMKLELEVQKRTKELSNSNISKNKLFAIIAHDLKNPLVSLQNITEKFQYLADNNEVERIGELAKYTEDKINVINENLNNVLNWALTERGLIRINPSQIHIKKSISEVLLMLKEFIETRDIKVYENTRETDRILFDLTSFQTILRNVINNAIVYATPKSVIQIESFKENGKIILIISNRSKDNYIKKEVIENPLKSIKGQNNTAGLGISIIKELMKLNNCDLQIKSSLEEGTQVLLFLPESVDS